MVRGSGGGIYNEGVLHVTDGSVIEANRAEDDGVGVYNTGTMMVSDSTVQRNHVPVDIQDLSQRLFGFAWNNDGAGIYNAGSLIVEKSHFLANVAHKGGAIYNAGVLNVSETTFDQNGVTPFDFDSPSEGGAIYEVGTTTTLSRSTISHGFADRGGGLFNASNAAVVVDTSTIANNSADSGGGLWGNPGTSTTLTSSTVAHNDATFQGGGIGNEGTFTLENSIVAENTSISGPDIFNTFGTLSTLGGNIVASTAGNSFPNVADPTDLFDLDGMIGPLGDYGGLTQTVGLRPGSPAINTSNPTTATTDQRGETRVNGIAADRGAFEFYPPITMRVETLDGAADGYFAPGEMSLADAVDWANAIPGHDTIALSDEFVTELRAEASVDVTADASHSIDTHIACYR